MSKTNAMKRINVLTLLINDAHKKKKKHLSANFLKLNKCRNFSLLNTYSLFYEYND